MVPRGLIWLGLNGQNVQGKLLRRRVVWFGAKGGERHRSVVCAGGFVAALVGRLSRDAEFCGRDLWSQDCVCDTCLRDDPCRGGY